MKYPIYLLLILSVTIATAQDQKFGLKGGVNFSSFEGTSSEGLTHKVGFHFGTFASFPLGKRITYQPEITFSREGNEFENLEDARTDFDYLNIVPLIFKFFPTSTGLNIQSGVQAGILLSAKSIIDNEKIDIKEFYFKENVSAIVGLGYEHNEFFFSARMNFGLFSILEADPDGELLSEVYQLSIGTSL